MPSNRFMPVSKDNARVIQNISECKICTGDYWTCNIIEEITDELNIAIVKSLAKNYKIMIEIEGQAGAEWVFNESPVFSGGIEALSYNNCRASNKTDSLIIKNNVDVSNYGNILEPHIGGEFGNKKTNFKSRLNNIWVIDCNKDYLIRINPYYDAKFIIMISYHNGV